LSSGQTDRQTDTQTTDLLFYVATKDSGKNVIYFHVAGLKFNVTIYKKNVSGLRGPI